MSVASAASTATVYVVHGIPKTPVDVYVDGKRALDDFQPGTSQGPVDLPAGPHKVAIFPADAADGSGSPLLSADADLPEGANVDAGGAPDADGKPTVTPFKNDVARSRPDRPGSWCGTPPPRPRWTCSRAASP